jgi:putative addiction module component (TIGR02574 family)
MTPTTQPSSADEVKLTPELVTHLLKLTPDDRATLADIMWDSVEGPEGSPEEVRQAWKDEIARRWERYKSGEERTYTLEEVMADLKAQAERRRG